MPGRKSEPRLPTRKAAKRNRQPQNRLTQNRILRPKQAARTVSSEQPDTIALGFASCRPLAPTPRQCPGPRIVSSFQPEPPFRSRRIDMSLRTAIESPPEPAMQWTETRIRVQHRQFGVQSPRATVAGSRNECQTHDTHVGLLFVSRWQFRPGARILRKSGSVGREETLSWNHPFFA